MDDARGWTDADAPWRHPASGRLLTLFATCPRGLEAALADELTGLGAQAAVAGSAGVRLQATWPVAEHLNRGSRLASRILLSLAEGAYRNERDILRLAATLPWELVLGPRQTLRVDTNSHRARVRSINFVTLGVKDAIVDRVREHFGERPDIDTRTPDVRVVVFVDERHAAIHLDLSGESLFKRGWRQADDKGAAPLKENLAAALPILAGWQPGEPLLDPFCGSGTILIEAGQRVAGIAPGAHRVFGFESLSGYRRPAADATSGERGRSHDAGSRASRPSPAAVDATAPLAPDDRPAPARLFGSDIDGKLVGLARANARRAGLAANAIRFTTRDAAVLEPPCPEPGWIVTNPPYGERLESLGELDTRLLGRRLRERFAGWRLAWLSADLDLPGRLALRPRRRIPLMNGALDCRLFVFDLG